MGGDWSTMAWEKIKRLEDENQKLRTENQALRTTLVKIKRVFGPSAPSCEGCATEIGEALKIIDEVKP